MVVEAEDSETLIQTIEPVRNVEGVLAVSLVYHRREEQGEGNTMKLSRRSYEITPLRCGGCRSQRAVARAVVGQQEAVKWDRAPFAALVYGVLV